jgi:MFS family permease
MTLQLQLQLQPQAPPPPPRPPHLTMILFSLTTILLFADQNLMGPNLSAIADEFGLSEQERDRKLGGDISLAFFLLGAPASLVVGCLADAADRSFLFAGTVMIGEGACLATYFVTSYPQLYVCRAVTGFSVGGALPLIYSILGDLYVPKDRHVVSAIVSFGTGAGLSIGQAIAGFLGPTFGWRLPFAVVAIPALLCAWAVWIFVPDPERGAAERWAAEGQGQGGLEGFEPLPTSSSSPSSTHATTHCTQQEDSGSDDGVALVPVSSFSSMNGASTKRHSLSSSCSAERIDDGVPNSTTIQQQSQPEQDDKLLWRYETATEPSTSYHYMYTSIYKSTYSQLASLWTHLRNTRNLLSTPTLLLALIQGASGCIQWGILNTFLNIFLSQDRGFTVELATTTLMCFSAGHVVGLILGGMGGSRLYSVDNRYPALLAGNMAIFGCFPFWWLLNGVDVSTPFWKVAGIAVLAGFGSGPTGPIVKATMANVTPPTSRGHAFALFNLFDDFGKGLGPFFVSVLIVQLGGRLPAFNVGVFGWMVCGVANLAIFCTVQKDEAVVVMYSRMGTTITQQQGGEQQNSHRVT